MSDATTEYWKDCIVTALDELNISLTHNEVDHLVGAVEGAHENYGMAFYSPSYNDRLNGMRQEEAAKLERLQSELYAYKKGAESVIRSALNIPDDTQIGVTENGELIRYGGRTERIL